MSGDPMVNVPRGGAPIAAPQIWRCAVDAGGVPAEWVEAALATDSQTTVVHLLDSDGNADATQESQAGAEQLAIATGARVLMVSCRSHPAQSLMGRVERGIAAYTWLLGEGCDLALSAFSYDAANLSLLHAVRPAANARRIPLPGLADISLPPLSR